MKRASLPPEMAELFSPYGLNDAQLVETDAHAPPRREPLDIWVSFIPRLRSFSAHREGLGEVRAASLRELLAKIAERLPDAEISLHLSRVAKREVVARRKGVRPAEGWH